MPQWLRQSVLRHQVILAVARPAVSCLRCCRNLIWWIFRSRQTKRYLASQEIRKLQIGAGPNLLPGWLNSDKYPSSLHVVFLNAAKPFPFGDRTFAYIFSEHLIEHLTYGEGLSMLRECCRCLKPGGRIRVATPSLETLISLWAHEKSPLQLRYIDWIIAMFIPEADLGRECFVINNAFQNWGHRFLYDATTLRRAMERAGLVDIKVCSVGESEDEAFTGIESHGTAVDDEEVNRFETMVLEARRPL
jgi:predicted SAM-dependent methyltransferase